MTQKEKNEYETAKNFHEENRTLKMLQTCPSQFVYVDRVAVCGLKGPRYYCSQGHMPGL